MLLMTQIIPALVCTFARYVYLYIYVVFVVSLSDSRHVVVLASPLRVSGPGSRRHRKQPRDVS